jgi:hypothetical protein
MACRASRCSGVSTLAPLAGLGKVQSVDVPLAGACGVDGALPVVFADFAVVDVGAVAMRDTPFLCGLAAGAWPDGA